MDGQLAASYDDVCRICGELYIQAQMKLSKMESNQSELVEHLNKQLAKTASDNDRLNKEISTLRTAYNELHAKRDSNPPTSVGENKS